MAKKKAPQPSTDIGPAFHPEDPEYLIRWHTHRGDVEDAPTGSGIWRDPSSNVVIDHADFPPPREQ